MNIPGKAPLIAALWFSLLAAGSSPAFGEEPRDDQQEATATPTTEPGEPAQPEPEKSRKTEGLIKPGKDKLNPEASQPGLLNPCRGDPPPRWCAE